MKKLLALVVVIVLVAVGWKVLHTPSDPKPAPTAAQAGASAALQDYLYVPYSTLNIAATDIHDYTRYQMESGSFGSKGLKYVVDADVTGQIKVYGHGITWASALDEFCRQNGCRWDVADPNTIRIRRAQAAQ